MKPLLAFLILLFIVACSHMQDDLVSISDNQGTYQSLLSNYENEYHYGPAVFFLPLNSNLDGKKFVVQSIFNGEYSIDSDSCGVHVQGRYGEGESIQLALTDLFPSTAVEKLCTVIVAIKPDAPSKSQVAVFPRYSVSKFQVSKRTNVKRVQHLRQGDSLPSLVFPMPQDTGEYRLQGKCSYETNSFSYNSFYSDGVIDLDETLLRYEKQKTGNCYYSILHTKDTNGKFTSRVILFFNTYNEKYTPLLVRVELDRKVDLEGPAEMYVCGIDSKIKNRKSSCRKSLSKLPKSFIVQGHTNKRSFYMYINQNKKYKSVQGLLEDFRE